jgi:hypothetical protein
LLVAVHIGPVGKLVMVLGGLYKRVGDVPDTIPYVSINMSFVPMNFFLVIVYIKKQKINFEHVVLLLLYLVRVFWLSQQ